MAASERYEIPHRQLLTLYYGVRARFIQIYLFRQVALSGIEVCWPDFCKDAQREVEIFQSIAPWEEWPGSVERGADLVHDFAQRNVRSGTAAIDAASIVFAHSVLDSLASDLIRLIRDIDGDGFASMIEQRKASLKDIRDKGIDAEYNRILDGYIAELCRCSLSERIAVLNVKCAGIRFELIGGTPFVYDPERLQRLDRLRQDIVHRLDMNHPVPNVADELSYMQQLCGCLVNNIRRQYDC